MSEENKNEFGYPQNTVQNYTEVQPNAPIQSEDRPTNPTSEPVATPVTAPNNPPVTDNNTGYNTSYYTAPNGNNTSSMYSYPNMQYHPNMQYTQYSSEPSKPPKKKKEKGRAGMIVLCIVLSTVFGLVGALGGLYLFQEYFPLIIQETSNSGDTVVIYENKDTEIPESVSQAGTVATVAEAALPSVVEISTEAVVTNNFYGQYVSEGAGSGVIISQDGYIVTNNHVVADASKITVRLSNGDQFEAKLIGKDPQTDVAVVKIEAQGLKPAIYGNSENLIVGELTVAIGNPLGSLGGTVTDGIISALDREITVEGESMTLLQTNAAVSPGNSGGGLFNAKGELIGIVNAKSTGESVEGLGFAIPINTARSIIESLIANGYVTGRPALGISTVEITTEYQKYQYRVNEYGVYITKSVSKDFSVGDRVVAIEGNSVSSVSDIKAIINSHKVGDKITVTVSRKGKIIDIQATLMDSIEATK